MKTQLYLITPPKIDLPVFADTLAETLDSGDVACVQLRLKDVSDDEVRQACEKLCPIVQDRDIAFVLNDRPDIAHEMECDGVHIGQDDTPYAQAREIVGPNAIVGVTCHDSKHLAMVAGEQGADYVAFGAFFPTDTKQAKTQADPALLHWWSTMFEVPCVAIGGITTENAPALIDAGADFLAVCGGVWQHQKGPIEAVKCFNNLTV